MELSEPKQPTPEEDCERYVFLNRYGGQWDRHALARRISRLREKANISDDCSIYTIRHMFGTDGVRANLNLHVLATLMGHSQISTTTKNYAHIDNDYSLLQKAAEQIRLLPAGEGGAP